MVVARIRRGDRVGQSGASTSIEGAWEAARTRRVVLTLVGIASLSVLLRVGLVSLVRAPSVFLDELGYQKLAQSIGQAGQLALFNEHGLSYSPLYPVVLSPIYALGGSGATAYTLIKITNAILVSLAVFPTYKIARFVLPRRLSLAVVGLSIAAPLMLYSSYSMSENLAYPVALTAIWAMLAAIRAPTVRNDLLLLITVGLACATRTELVALVPAILTAVLLAAALDRERGSSLVKRLVGAPNRHRLLFGVVAFVLVAAGVAALAGRDVIAAFGRYAVVARSGLPNLGQLAEILLRHVAGLDFAVGFVPFAGALVAAMVFARRGLGGRALPFAAVAVSTTAWLLVVVSYDAWRFDRGSDVPRIHERFLIYVIPFFLVALLATFQRSMARTPTRVYLGAVIVAALLPLAVPYHTVVNATIAVDTFGLAPFSYSHRGVVKAVPFVPVVAVGVAAILGLAYFAERRRLRGTLLLVLFTFVVITLPALARIVADSHDARSYLPERPNWVDAAHPDGPVVVITGSGKLAPPRETAYFNLSISRLYYLCRPIADPEFGGQQVTIDGSGRLRDASGPLEAQYAVAPTRFGLRGRVLATNKKGHEVLVAPPGGRLEVGRPGPAARCASSPPG